VADGAQAIATSREALSLSCESIVPVGGLSVPPVDAHRETLDDYAAMRLVRLAVRRAQSQTLSGDTAERLDTAKVCRLVDGLPLGLELAGSWSRVLPWREIADRMSRDLNSLSSTNRDTPVRYRSLRSVFGQTWILLTGEQRQALTRLAVFRGGFSSGAAETVARVTPASLAAPGQRNLVQRTGADRYQLHDTK